MCKQQMSNVISIVWTVLILLALSPLAAFLSFSSSRYYSRLPTVMLHPDDELEAADMKHIVSSRDGQTTKLFHLADRGGASAIFNATMPEHRDTTLSPSVTTIMTAMVLFFKLLFNRRRPYQTDPNMGHIDTPTSYSPSFPSGHALQAYLLARTKAKYHPEKADKILALGERCAFLRVDGGVHYPSDLTFARRLAYTIPHCLL